MARPSASSEPGRRAGPRPRHHGHPRRAHPVRGHPVRGMALVMVLVGVVLISLSVTVPLRQARLEAQREREAELLFIGRQFRDAIADYVAATPGPVKRYPVTLAQLLQDDRFPQPRRHLRRLYRDPYTGQAEWALIREQGAIVGVASRGTALPMKRAGFDRGEEAFEQARSVADWRFVHRQDNAAGRPAPAPQGPITGSPLPDAERGNPGIDGTPPGDPTTGAGPPPDGGAVADDTPPSTHDRAPCLPRYAAALQACNQGDPVTRATCRDAARGDWQRCLQGR